MVNTAIYCDLMLVTLHWEFQIFIDGQLMYYTHHDNCTEYRVNEKGMAKPTPQ
jgi:hypothetical protein